MPQENRRTFAWVMPQVSRPELKGLEYEVSPEDKVTSFKGGSLTCKNLRYGPKGSFQFTPPSLPHAKAETHEKFDIVLFMQVFANVMRLFTDGK